MFESIWTLLSIAVAAVASIGGYVTMKKFVRERLRFVDGVHRRGIPLLAGLAAGAVAGAVAILPFITWYTAILFGIGIGTGIAAGRRDIKRLPSP